MERRGSLGVYRIVLVGQRGERYGWDWQLRSGAFSLVMVPTGPDRIGSLGSDSLVEQWNGWVWQQWIVMVCHVQARIGSAVRASTG